MSLFSVMVSFMPSSVETIDDFVHEGTVLHGLLSLDRAAELVEALLTEFEMELVSATILSRAASDFKEAQGQVPMGPE